MKSAHFTDLSRPRIDFRWPRAWLVLRISTAFLVLGPLITLLLLKTKEFPAFPGPDWVNALPWIYRALSIPSWLAGITLGLIIVGLTFITDYLHDPFDVGRAFSVSAVGGAVVQTLAVAAQQWIQRQALPHPFWLATGAISGCLCGGLAGTLALRRMALPKPWEQIGRNWAFATAIFAGGFLLGSELNYMCFARALLSASNETRLTAQELAVNVSTSPHHLSRMLTHFLRVEDPDQRRRAAEALGVLGVQDIRVIHGLERMSQDAEPSVRDAAAHALSHLRSSQPLPPS